MRRTEKAAILQDDGFLTELATEVRLRYFNKWKTERDPARRNQLWMQTQVVDDVVQLIASWANEERMRGSNEH